MFPKHITTVCSNIICRRRLVSHRVQTLFTQTFRAMRSSNICCRCILIALACAMLVPQFSCSSRLRYPCFSALVSVYLVPDYSSRRHRINHKSASCNIGAESSYSRLHSTPNKFSGRSSGHSKILRGINLPCGFARRADRCWCCRCRYNTAVRRDSRIARRRYRCRSVSNCYKRFPSTLRLCTPISVVYIPAVLIAAG